MDPEKLSIGRNVIGRGVNLLDRHQLTSLLAIITAAHVQGETTQEPRSILKQDSFSPSRRCLRLLYNKKQCLAYSMKTKIL